MKTRAFTSWMALGLLALAAAPLAAQRPFGPPGGFEIAGVEQALRLRTALELTDAQVTSLDQLRRESLARHKDRVTRVMDLRSDLRAGEITSGQLRDALEEGREAMEEAAEQTRTRLEEILTEEQMDELRDSRGPGWGEGRPGLRGHRGLRGRGGPPMGPRFRRGWEGLPGNG